MRNEQQIAAYQTKTPPGNADFLTAVSAQTSVNPKQVDPFDGETGKILSEEIERRANNIPFVTGGLLRTMFFRLYRRFGPIAAFLSPTKIIQTLMARQQENPPQILQVQDDLFFMQKASEYLRLQKPEEARDEFSKAIQFNSSNSEAWYQRSSVFRDLGQHELELSDLTTALKLNPNDYRIHHQIALFFRNNVQPSMRGVYDFHYGMAKFLKDTGLTIKDSIVGFSKALELAPDDSSLLFSRALAHYLNEDISLATEDLMAINTEDLEENAKKFILEYKEMHIDSELYRIFFDFASFGVLVASISLCSMMCAQIREPNRQLNLDAQPPLQPLLQPPLQQPVRQNPIDLEPRPKKETRGSLKSLFNSSIMNYLVPDDEGEISTLKQSFERIPLENNKTLGGTLKIIFKELATKSFEDFVRDRFGDNDNRSQDEQTQIAFFSLLKENYSIFKARDNMHLLFDNFFIDRNFTYRGLNARQDLVETIFRKSEALMDNIFAQCATSFILQEIINRPNPSAQVEGGVAAETSQLQTQPQNNHEYFVG